MAEKIVKDSQGLAKDLVNDCISRTAAIDIVRFECGEWEGLAKTIIKRFEQLPSAQPERKRGKWKPYRCDMYECSECGYIYTELTDRHICGANFCPHCGADMREVDDERFD